MQVLVESLSKVEKRVKVIVPSQRVEKAIDEQFVVFAKKVDLKGFRPGKVPLQVVKQRFAQEVKHEAINALIRETLNEAIHQQNLQPISQPRVETQLGSTDLEYTATFDILPETGPVQFNPDHFEKKTAIVTDKDVEQTLERVREQNVQWEKVNRKAQEKDKINGKIQMFTEDGNPMTPDSMPLEFILRNEPSIFGWNLTDKLAGAEIGEMKQFSHTLPPESFLQGLAGKTLEFRIEVLDIFEPSLPALDDAFAKRLGIKSGELQELRSEIRKQLELNLKRTMRSLLKESVFDKLLEQNPIEVPQSLVDREAKHLHDDHCKGTAAGHAHKHSQEDEAQMKAMAKKRIQLGLLVGEVASKNKIKTLPERVEAYLLEFASVYADADEYIRRMKADQEGMKEIETFVLEDQIVEKLLENVSIVEKEVSYEELIMQGNTAQEKISG